MRYRIGDLADAGLALAATALGLGVAIAVLGELEFGGPLPVLAIALLVAIGDYLTRPLLRVMATRTGAVGALLAGLAAQVLVLWAALEVVPGVRLAGPQVVPGVLLLSGAVMALGRWLIGVNDSEYVLGDVIRRARSRARRSGSAPSPARREPGLLIVQLDGVGRDTLGVAIEAGLAPTMYRWLRTGSHRLTTWWVRVPTTTPASQAALLYGDASAIPAFRWWDRELGRLLVANRPADAAKIERRLEASPSANPLLRPGDAAISMMFSGGASSNALVMSRAGREGIGPGPAFRRMFASPFVLVRSITLTLAEMVKELFQAHRQRVRGVVPRVNRGGWYVVLRGITNVLLRDLNTSLVAENLMRGTPVVVVDLVDYDEIAHHAGPHRPEALRALEGLDRVLGLLEKVCEVAPRDYRIVVVSDHGQSLGPTFADAYGVSLADLVTALMGDAPQSVAVPSGEDVGPVNALLATVFPSRAQETPRPGRRRRVRLAGQGEAPLGDGESTTLPEVAVVGGGNFGSVWFPREAQPLVLEEVRERWEHLVSGLAAHPGVGLVVARTSSGEPVALGARGLRWLDSDRVEGDDPVEGWPQRTASDLLRAIGLDGAGDLVLVSAVSPMGHVHAFEGQVGSHGGIGGPQNEAILIYPGDVDLDDGLREKVDGKMMFVGGEAVHAQLLKWLRAWGLR